VGNTANFSRSFISPPVHPHARGEHLISCRTFRTFHGSSPRAWGTLLIVDSARDLLRFIPTRVGNTSGDGSVRFIMPVHPHARGEHIGNTGPKAACDGSSPRAWGTPLPP